MGDVKKITGSMDQMLHYLMTDPDVRQTQRIVIDSPEDAKEQIKKDIPRVRVFTGRNQTSEEARSNFFGAVNTEDTLYAQGDWEGRLPDVVIAQALPVHLMNDPALTTEGLELITRINQRERNIAFGYVSQNGTACSFSVLSFELEPGKREFMVCQIDDLAQSKLERQTTVYISDGLYKFMEERGYLSLPEHIKVESLPIESLPLDMMDTINEPEVAESLAFMVIDSQIIAQTVSIASGFEVQELTSLPIVQLPPSTLRKRRDSSGDLLKETVISASRQAYESSTPMSEEEIDGLVRQSLAVYVSMTASELAQGLEEQKASHKGLLGSITAYKETHARHRAESAIKELDNIGNELIENKISNDDAITRIAQALTQLKHSSLKNTASLKAAEGGCTDLLANISLAREITANTNTTIFDSWSEEGHGISSKA